MNTDDTIKTSLNDISGQVVFASKPRPCHYNKRIIAFAVKPTLLAQAHRVFRAVILHTRPGRRVPIFCRGPNRL